LHIHTVAGDLPTFVGGRVGAITDVIAISLARSVRAESTSQTGTAAPVVLAELVHFGRSALRIANWLALHVRELAGLSLRATT
jgi:hypothetical protein